MKILISLKWLATPVMALFVFLPSCKETSGGHIEITHEVMKVSKSDRQLSTDYSARLKGCQSVEIRPQVGGMITDIRINEGDRVHKGQVLFVIDQAPFKAALETAKANVTSVQAKLETANLVLDSKKELYSKEIISQYDLKTADNAVKELEAELTQAKALAMNAENDLSYTEVKSPVNGTASMIPYRVGALVSGSIAQPLVTVSDASIVYAYFSMSENQIIDIIQRFGSIQKAIQGMEEVSLRLSNGTDYTEKGHIDAISGSVDEATGAVALRASFDNPDGLLLNGAIGTVVIPEYKKDCIVIPQTATFEIQDRKFAYKVVDGLAVAAPIDVFRLNNGKEFVVESGLSEGDVIIREGAGLVREGMKINVGK